ncbi:MAG: hypothetical protein A2341_19910 [Deltaproteobacteria bacterium RIFOXYB12_FULL_58_9]|nr:MAG: hypothetical protein A2341_19910 [Deltaproteobacteria bacterium RIFOXYB12_FULL_58_9]
MGRKRVHELAKEFGLENKDALSLLQGAGISVKTHSSSVYEDEARAVLQKATNKTAMTEEKPAPKRQRPGMMIVRKRKEDSAEVDADESTVADGEAPAVEVEGTDADEISAIGIDESDEVYEPEDGPLEAAMDFDVSGALGGEATTEEFSSEPADADADVDTEPTVAAEANEPHAPVADVAPKGGQPQQPGPVKTNKDRPRSATVVRMIDREKLLERVPNRRLGNQPTAQNGQNSQNAQNAQNAQKFGKVTELRVVTDPFGRGREMVDVGRDKKGRAGARVTRRTRAPTKREMMEMRERAMHPSRLKRKKGAKRVTRKTEVTQPKASKRVIKMRETISVSDLAHQLGIKAVEIIRKLMDMGMMVGINAPLDYETAEMIAQEHEYTVDSVAFAEEVILTGGADEDKPEDLVLRPPVVTVMGHVDHGKTSLLDYIRKTKVAKGEAGGITQHIGAYQVKVGKKGSVTFLDTPGHAAFTSMRARGAQVTDIVILVVAADDGTMPQTEEAIRHAQAAGVPIIVAINKIDKPDANPERVQQELSKFELVPEAWGGQTLMVNTSATKGTGIDELLETIVLQAEILELKANPNRPAEGVVIEANLDKGRGPVATVLVQRGTLRRGDAVVVGGTYGKVRAMSDAKTQQRKEAGPSSAVEITGLDSVPEAGDPLNVVENAEKAREVAEHRRELTRSQEQTTTPRMTLEDLMARMKGNETLELRVVLKADVKGSVEAVQEALEKLSTDEVKVNVIQGGVGAITESDIMLAAASQGYVFGFGVRPDANARLVADREGVDVRTYTIIYEMVDAVKKAMEGLLTPESKEKVVGHAEVREVFRVSKVGTIAGCRVTDGKAMRAAKVRVLRDSVQVYEGKVSSLKHFKDDAREVDSGLECGVGVEGFNDVKQGDVLQFFQVEEIARTLESTQGGKRSPGAEAHP